jgi:predicted nucleic acid-binding protein
MSKNRLLAFVDSNVLIEAFFVPLHPACAIAILAANKQLDLVTCSLVVDDVEKEILERATERDDYDLIDAWAKFLTEIRLRKMPDPPASLVRDTLHNYLGVMRHQADIPVLASAIETGAHVILSDNSEHFNPKVSERCGIPIWTCEEFLAGLITGTIKEKLGITK